MDRIAKIAERLTTAGFGIGAPGGPEPKFKRGDKVVTYAEGFTEVWSVGDYDDYLKDRRYIVVNPITRSKRNFNEKGMKMASEWVTAAEVGKICKACEGKMLASGITRVRRSFFEEAMRGAKRDMKAKAVSPILDVEQADSKLWRDIRDVAYEVHSMSDEDEEGFRTTIMVEQKTRELAGKYMAYYSKTRRELEDTIREYIWETYHMGS